MRALDMRLRLRSAVAALLTVAIAAINIISMPSTASAQSGPNEICIISAYVSFSLSYEAWYTDEWQGLSFTPGITGYGFQNHGTAVTSATVAADVSLVQNGPTVWVSVRNDSSSGNSFEGYIFFTYQPNPTTGACT